MAPATLRFPDAPWAVGEPARLIAALDSDGEEARVIGGAVRNLLLGEQVADLDIATTAHPDEVTRRARALGFKVVPTGAAHGTVTVVIDGKPHEVTTLREDVETFGRKAIVRFGRDWQKDAERRDFTINALSMTRHGDVIDTVGGLPDIEQRRVRFIGDARQRIREDYLRILRFYRFHARYGAGAPDAEGVAATIAERDGLQLLSRERVRAELLKLLAAPGAPETVALMAEAGLLLPFLGVAIPPQLTRLARLEAALSLEAAPVRRLGALALFVTDDAARFAERLRLSANEEERLRAMAESLPPLMHDHSEAAGQALLYRCEGNREAFADKVLLAWVRSEAAPDEPAWRALFDLPGRWQPPKFPIRAADLIALGLEKGPALGAALAAAEAEWISAGFPSDVATVKALAARHARR
ncbi:CCA-adding enzyme [Variibacter gotjawalensis]|uniref:CCA-adding enzyme n=1 Tax=Variibacter gotjawalensis TaxID=1333996 RepID=A0A0S3PSW8_9BRAD|nr:CCA tRNA nucleotidyltransferase [Variibacter gotjawalensis]NIK49225.1 poly(A) polymerase [Variibacter gotjawalensis]RZS51078.1 poly(A) polymerase [Variibacter gotjawalensis]BAT58912.1 CCA-adding enzyme [Variibacter gotjawalensis]